jgi:hypothetical protein
MDPGNIFYGEFDGRRAKQENQPALSMLRPENLYIQMIYKTGLSDKVNYIVKEFD